LVDFYKVKNYLWFNLMRQFTHHFHK
jgi:hypothetical protein